LSLLDPENWTATPGLLLTEPLKLVTGAEKDSPLIAASIAAFICGSKVLITELTRESAFPKELTVC